jgi:hypothetical protein
LRTVAVVSCDEKPGIQAIATTAPVCRLARASTPPSSATTKTNGWARSRLSRPWTSARALCTNAVTPHHHSREFASFLQQLDAAYAAGLLMRILLENH